MADIAPFRGWRHDPARVQDMACAISLPYDLIDDALRRELFDRSPYNVARIIAAEPDRSAEGGAQYRAAADLFQEWIASGVIRQDAEPAIYAYEQIFSAGGERRSRVGLIALVRLGEFGEGVIPHERTLSGPKADRLNLLRATHTQFGQIFTVYSDPEHRLQAHLDSAKDEEPLLDVTGDGLGHRLWAITDDAAIRAIQEVMKDKDLFIADGHHRFETAHNYRAERPDCEAAGWRMMTLVNMASTGLVILPIHRLVRNVPDFDAAQLLKALADEFEIAWFPGLGLSSRDRMFAAMREAAASEKHAFGLHVNDDHYYVLVLREGVCLEGWSEVRILQERILKRVLGIGPEQMAAHTHVEYVNDTGPAVVDDAVSRVESGAYQALFCVNPTPVEAVAAVAAAGETMTQKSTFFYPKVYTGLVMNRLDA